MLKRAFEGNNAENTSNISTQTVQLLQETDKGYTVELLKTAIPILSYM